jgi:hypothetical protein
MANIPKANVVNGNTIEATDISNIIDALDGTTAYDITISGTLALNTTESSGSGHVVTYNTSSGTFTYTSSAAIGGGGTVTTDGITITGDGSVGSPLTSLTIPAGGAAAIQVDDGAGLFDGNAESLLDVKDSIIFLGSTHTHISGQRNIAVGEGHTIESENSIIIGEGGQITGSNSLIVGSGNFITNDSGDPKNGCLIAGYSNVVSSSAGAAIGIGLRVSGSGQTVVGTYNALNDSTSPFIVGIGSGSVGAARQTGFKVTQSGSMVTKFGNFGGGVPTWTGSQGELVVGKAGSVNTLWLYVGIGGTNGWFSASFSG